MDSRLIVAIDGLGVVRGEYLGWQQFWNGGCHLATMVLDVFCQDEYGLDFHRQQKIETILSTLYNHNMPYRGHWAWCNSTKVLIYRESDVEIRDFAAFFESQVRVLRREWTWAGEENFVRFLIQLEHKYSAEEAESILVNLRELRKGHEKYDIVLSGDLHEEENEVVVMIRFLSTPRGGRGIPVLRETAAFRFPRKK